MYSVFFSNRFLTDENQEEGVYHTVQTISDWLKPVACDLLLTRAGVISPSTRGQFHVEVFNKRASKLSISIGSTVGHGSSAYYDY